jgi:DNA-binding transcriptional MocR family regulator
MAIRWRFAAGLPARGWISAAAVGDCRPSGDGARNPLPARAGDDREQHDAGRRLDVDDHTHGFMQAVLADFIAGGHFSAHLRSMRTLYAGRHDALYAALSRHGLRELAPAGPGCGMHATLDLPLHVGDAAAAASAAHAGIRVQPLARYCAGVPRRNGLLLGYSALSERRIGAGVARLARVLHRLGPGRPRPT